MSPHYDGLFIFSCRVKQIIEDQAYINFETSATLCLHHFVVFRWRDASQTERSDNRSSKCDYF